MVSETTSSPLEASGGRSSSPCRKISGPIPKRIHKAEREKLKREHLNELFQDLANALGKNSQELNQANNGKASILCEAARLLKGILGQIDSLKKENIALLSESQYVAVEKNELKEENSALEAQVETLRNELNARVVESKPDLNVPPPPTEYEEEPRDTFGISHAEQQGPTVLIVPINPGLTSYPLHASNVSKPHARYPTPADSWPVQLLGEQIMQQIKEPQLSCSRR